jgi:hypothetical protein
VIHYGPRTLTQPPVTQPLPDDNDRLPLLNRMTADEMFITHDATQWVGDDCDYYGPIIYFLAAINKIEF